MKIVNKLLDLFLGEFKTPKYKEGDAVIFDVGVLSYISGTRHCTGIVKRIQATREYVGYWCESPQMTTGYNDKLMEVFVHENKVKPV